jgi:hypothetical protein
VHSSHRWKRCLVFTCVAVGLSDVVLLAGAMILPRVIAIELTGRELLPAVTSRRLAEQVRTIWHTHGVRVQGLEEPTTSPITLYVELSDRSGPPEAVQRLELGVFHRGDNHVMVSLPAALRIALAAVPTRESPAWADMRRDVALGTVLGRTIAHEIGHFLLGPAHSKSGLMRASFRAAEIADPRSGAFNLTRVDLARLLAVSQSPLSSSKAVDQRVADGGP